MRTLLATLALAVLLLAEDAKPLPEGASLDIVVIAVQGEVDVQTAPKTKPVAAAKGMKIPVGAKIYTGIESAIQLSFGTNSTATLDPVTTCEVKAFEMKGDQLVANIFISPGVADVKLKQLAAFHTDFQVSTPRLTCSVRGSGSRTWANGDEIRDGTVCTDDEAHARDSTGREHTLPQGSQTNHEGDSNNDLAQQENRADTTPDGATPQETENPDLVSNNDQSIDPVASDATTNTSSSPSGGDTSGGTQPPPPPPSDAIQNDMEHDVMHAALASEEAMSRAELDLPDQDDENSQFDAFHQYGHENGAPALVDHAAQQRLSDFNAGINENPDSSLRDQMANDYDDESTGFNVWHSNMRAVAEDARNSSGGGGSTASVDFLPGDPSPPAVDLSQFELALLAGQHINWHEHNADLDNATYNSRHSDLHDSFVDPLLSLRGSVAPSEWLSFDVSKKDNLWHSEHPDSEEPGYDAKHTEFHEVLNDYSARAQAVIDANGGGD